MSAEERRPTPSALTVLEQGTVEVVGRLPWSSNATFLADVRLGDVTMRAVYKPHRGERPLWDFPDGLFLREVAAYRLSDDLGWELVPETVARGDGPLGMGSLQRFVDADFEQHYFTLLEDPRHHDTLRLMATFDLVINNADRKGGHCLLDGDGHIWGIDHGLSFHAEPKLRTVIWDFAREPFPAAAIEALQAFRRAVQPSAYRDLLDDEECDALFRRVDAVLSTGCFPDPGRDHRPYPWPLV